MAVQAIQLNNQLDQQELISTLKASLYPEASDASVRLVISYCKALRLDPIMRVVHIVKFGNKEVLLPGIGLYRTLAHRSGVYAGLSEPEFGPTITEEFQKPLYKWTRVQKKDGSFYNKREVVGHEAVKVAYPEWCKITAKKIVLGKIVETTTVEYWKENYATVSNDSNCPNEMWTKRPHGQLSKCTECQCLRKMFPEFIPQQPTFEEMEGKELIGNDYIEGTAEHVGETKQLNAAESVKEKLKAKLKVEQPIEVQSQAMDAVIENSTVVAMPRPEKLVDVETIKHLSLLYQSDSEIQKKIDLYLNHNKLNKMQEIRQGNADRLIEKLEYHHPLAKSIWEAYVFKSQDKGVGTNV